MFLLKKRYWLSLTLLLTVVLVARAIPASWAIFGVQKAFPQLQASGVSGSPWNGQADFAQWAQRGQIFPIGQLQWQLQWPSLLTLNPCVHVSAAAAQQRIAGKTCYSIFTQVVSINDADISLPIARVSPFFSVDLEGDVDAYVDYLAWQDQQLGDTQAQLTWQKAQLSNGSEWIPLGDIQALINDDGAGGIASKWDTIETQQKPSPVQIELSAQLNELSSQQPSMRITGSIVPGPRASSLRQLLQFIGEPVGAGAYKIDIDE